MRTALAVAFAAFFAAVHPASAAGAQSGAPEDIIVSAEGLSLSDFHWLKRVVVVLANNAADPRFVQQMELITSRLDALDDRDVVVITDTDPAARSAVRSQLRARDFMIVLISKEGEVVLRKPVPWDVRELSRSIDKLPLRQQEVRDRHDALRR